MKKTSVILFLICILCVISSCSNTKPYDMLTVVNPNGTLHREFTVEADTGFMLGETKAQAKLLPIILDSTWTISWKTDSIAADTRFPISRQTLDSILRVSPQIPNFQVTIQKDFASVENMASTFKLAPENSWSKLKVTYKFSKKFRWFYTYYEYRESYPKIQTNFTKPLTSFMSANEAAFWLKGGTEILAGMNGMEIRNYTGEIEDKFNQWIYYNLWVNCCDIVADHYQSLKQPPVDKETFLQLKDSIYIHKVAGNQDFDLPKILNAYFKTTAYSSLDKNKDLFDNILEESGLLTYSDVQFNYRLQMPGILIFKPNNCVVQENEVVWKLTSDRLLLDGFTLEAHSRKANIWAFIISLITILLASWKIIQQMKNKKQML